MADALVESPLQFLQLVADPLRWSLLVHLGRSDLRVGELAELVGKAHNLVSYHLGELRGAGLVSARRSAADGRDTYYRLNLAQCSALLSAAGTELHPALDLAPVDGVFDGPVPRRRQRVLFLCTGNSARSQIAQALLETRSGNSVAAKSAGSRPKPLHPNAVRVMAERGIDITGRQSKHLDRYTRTRFDRVITLCDKVREVCPEFPGPPVSAHWSMPDPAAAAENDEATYPAFVEAADDIEGRVAALISELSTRPQHERSSHAAR